MSERVSEVERAYASIQKRIPIAPRVALVLGSGLSALADSFTDSISIPYGDIAGMPAAGGLQPGLAGGSLLAISDHLNLTGQNCLVGANDPALGPRFPDMSDAYDPGLRALAREAAAQLGLTLHEGIYAGVLGPSYETPAEVRMLRLLGASVVGMSTVQEVIAARHLGMRVLGLSCVTNLAAGLSLHPLTHLEVEATARASAAALTALVRALVPRIEGDAAP